MKQFADSAEVKSTSARMRSYNLAQVCPTSAPEEKVKLNEVDFTAARKRRLQYSSVCAGYGRAERSGG